MSEPILYWSRIVPDVGQPVATGVPQGLRVYVVDAGSLGGGRQH
jgi:hypothetical protein